MSIHNSIKQVNRPDTDQFSDDYRMQVYLTWYNRGKPNAERLHRMLDNDPSCDMKPAVVTLQLWIRDRFIPHAMELDDQVADQVDQAMIQQRIEMANRHAEIGRELQELGLQYLRENDIKTDKAALTALIKGVEIEREALTLPTDMLAKLDRMTDDDLLEQVTHLLQDGKLLDITPHNPDGDHADNEKTASA